MIVPLFVGREKSIRALEEVMGSDKQIMLATQINASDDDPNRRASMTSAPLPTVLQLLKLPDGTVKVLVEGRARAEIVEYTDREEYYEARAVELCRARGRPGRDRGAVALGGFGVRKLRQAQQEDLAGSRRRGKPDRRLFEARRHGRFASVDQDSRKAGHAFDRFGQGSGSRSARLHGGEISVLQVEKRIRSRVKRQMEKTQREYYLNEQMKAIQKELGDGEDGRDEMAELEAGSPRPS
jgi:ATP-dependent Lon protease